MRDHLRAAEIKIEDRPVSVPCFWSAWVLEQVQGRWICTGRWLWAVNAASCIARLEKKHQAMGAREGTAYTEDTGQCAESASPFVLY